MPYRTKNLVYVLIVLRLKNIRKNMSVFQQRSNDFQKYVSYDCDVCFLCCTVGELLFCFVTIRLEHLKPYYGYSQDLSLIGGFSDFQL